MTINTVAARRGLAWLREGVDYFVHSAGSWTAVTILFVVCKAGLSMFKVGLLISWLIGPMFMGGLMLGCRNQDRSGGLEVKFLFAGFSREHVGPLLLTAILYFIGFIGAVLISALLVALAAGGASLLSMLQAGSIAAITSYPIIALLFILIVALLVLPLLMAMWFAPALITLSRRSATAALWESFVGCLRNWLSLLVYSAILLGAVILAAIPLTVVGVFLVPDSLHTGYARVVSIIAVLVATPIVTASVYLSYKDIFEEPVNAEMLPGSSH